MKTSFRVLTVGIFAFLFTVALSAPALAQECDQETKTAVYQEYLDNYAGNIDQRKKAVEAAKKYIQICGSSEVDAEIVKYLKDAVPALEKGIQEELVRIEEQKKAQAEIERLNRFDKAYRAENWDEVFAAGDAFLKEPPVKLKIHLDMRILLASAGSVLAEEKKINKYNDLTLKYAQEAISRINAGEESGSKKWGAYNYSWGTKDNALGWLHYAIGFIKYYPQEKRDEAIAYYYKAAQFTGDTKSYPPLYATIGLWYQSKAAKLGEDRAAIDITEAAGEEQKANIDKALAILGKEKGYAERAMDAFARAYKLAQSQKGATPEYKNGLYSTLKSLFAFRYSSDEEVEKRSEASINTYVAGVTSDALPNPANEPQPVVEKKPADAADSTHTSTDGSATGSATGGRSRTVGAVVKKTGN